MIYDLQGKGIDKEEARSSTFLRREWREAPRRFYSLFLLEDDPGSLKHLHMSWMMKKTM